MHQNVLFFDERSFWMPFKRSPLDHVRIGAKITWGWVSKYYASVLVLLIDSVIFLASGGVRRTSQMPFLSSEIGLHAGTVTIWREITWSTLVDKRQNIQNTLSVVCFSPLGPFSLISWRICPKGNEFSVDKSVCWPTILPFQWTSLRIGDKYKKVELTVR